MAARKIPFLNGESSMTEKQVIKIIRTHIDRQFPKDCLTCGRHFSSLKEYLQNTTHVGNPHSADADLENWQPKRPAGTISLADCLCGNTLAISSHGMSLVTMWRLLGWARKESSRREISVDELLSYLRQKIDKQVLEQKEGG
jgi:hypothetical protein